MGTVMFEYLVKENFEDEPPETFGHCHLPTPPSVGEVIQLRWLDGTEAYKVRVESVEVDTLWVTRDGN